MVAAPGRPQPTFTAGELDPALHYRRDLKYYSTAARRMENVVVSPHGGFTNRPGLRHLAEVAASACRIFPFKASDGSVYDLIGSNAQLAAHNGATVLQNIAVPHTAAQMAIVNTAQQLDTLLMFHPDVPPHRVKHAGPTSWSQDVPAWNRLPTWDYGATYTNGVAAVWELNFLEYNNDQSYTENYRVRLVVSGHETYDIPVVVVGGDIDWTAMAALIQGAILLLPNVKPGVTATKVAGANKKIRVTFGGDGNQGDGWAVSGAGVRYREEYITAAKVTVGVKAGEDIMSATRGYPRCGAFFQQRLILAGFRSLPNTLMYSASADYYNMDERLEEANGAAVVPMDTAGGEAIERLVAGRNLMIFTSEAEYWVSDRAIDKTQPINIVEASRNGSAAGVPIVENEGAALFVHAQLGVIGEFRYTDTDGNFSTRDLSLLGAHLVSGVSDAAILKPARSTDGSLLALASASGDMRLATLLRQQDVTAITRATTPGLVKAVAANGAFKMSALVERPKGSGVSRRFERFEVGLLLDGAITQTLSSSATVTGLGVHEGRTVWAIADGDVFGPFTVASGTITLPRAATDVTVGLWSPPVVETLTPPRDIGPQIAMQRPGRIHSAVIAVEDTTSLAISANGGPVYDVDLVSAFGLQSGPELERGVTGLIQVTGLTGWQDEPTLTLTQLRPGRLTVRSVIVQAKL